MAIVLGVFAHADDETLAMSAMWGKHLAAGHEMHALLMSRSPGSAVLNHLNGIGINPWWGRLHHPAEEGYELLTPEQFGLARYIETKTALECLSSGLGTITLWEAHLEDGYTVGDAQQAILDVCDVIAPGQPVRLKGHSDIVDNHADHLAVGGALRLLRSNPLYTDVRNYVLPSYWNDPRLTQVVKKWEEPNNQDMKNMILNACKSFGSWSPGNDVFGIGHHSVYDKMFKPLMAAPHSMYHA